MARRIDLMGRRYERLIVIALGPKAKRGKSRWCCRCDCGTEKIFSADSLRRGKSRSCGCLRLETNTTHGKSKDPAYNCYRAMMTRCYYQKAINYKNYGGRGITVCDRWRASLEAFLEDMGPRPSPEHSIDRIDSDGNYTPENTRWVTSSEQAHNRRNTKLSEELVSEVRKLATQGGNVAAWARAHGVHKNYAKKVVRGETWKDP